MRKGFSPRRSMQRRTRRTFSPDRIRFRELLATPKTCSPINSPEYLVALHRRNMFMLDLLVERKLENFRNAFIRLDQAGLIPL